MFRSAQHDSMGTVTWFWALEVSLELECWSLKFAT